MDNRLVLVPEEEGATYGTVKPVAVNGSGLMSYGLSVGGWSLSSYDNRIYIDLLKDIDTVIHEVATTKSVKAELRAADKDAKGTEIKPVVTYDPRTKRFKQVMPLKE